MLQPTFFIPFKFSVLCSNHGVLLSKLYEFYLLGATTPALMHGSHQNSEVKRGWARVVLGWVTSWEVLVLHPTFFIPLKFSVLYSNHGVLLSKLYEFYLLGATTPILMHPIPAEVRS